jgi:Arc/MetJ-type ribon-helix-helix transcriptional regulator
MLDQPVSTRHVCGMQIDLTPEQQDFVRQAVESGRFDRAEDAVQAAMALWVERERRRTEILAAVDIAKASIGRGEGIETSRGRKTEWPGAVRRRASPREANIGSLRCRETKSQSR